MKRIALLFVLTSIFGNLFAQKNVVDKVVAVVGDEIILKSDIENIFQQSEGYRGTISSLNYKTQILEQQLMQKLLIAQAKIDSVVISESEILQTINSRIEQMTERIGSKEKLEAYFNKNIDEIKETMWEPTKNNLLSERMKGQIVEKIRITPSEVKQFYKTLSKDSLPKVGAKYVLQEIVLKPKITDKEKERIIKKLRDFRKQILDGETTFRTLAVLYSEDGSALKGGELDYTAKTGWDPEFAKAAFSLKPGQISKIVESEFGYHIIQMIDKKDGKAKVRHIILIPKVSSDEEKIALNRLDSIKTFVLDNKMTFEEAAFYFSTEKSTKNNGGVIADPRSSDIKLPKTSIRNQMAQVVNELKEGQISEPFVDMSTGIKEYKIVKIKSYFPSHIADLDEDWIFFENLLKQEKQTEKLKVWVHEKQLSTYIHLDEIYKNAKFEFQGWIKE